MSDKVPLPDIDDLPAEPESMSTWELTQRLRVGEMRVASIHEQTVDSWLSGTGSDAYDPAATYTRATNRFDHAVTQTVKIPTEVDMMVTELVQRLPMVKNKTEFVRDAIVHNLHRYAAMMGSFDKDWARRLQLEVIRCHQDRIAVETSQWDEIISKGQEIMERLAANNDTIALGEALDFHAVVAEQSPEPWKGKLMDVVDRYRKRM